MVAWSADVGKETDGIYAKTGTTSTTTTTTN